LKAGGGSFCCDLCDAADLQIFEIFVALLLYGTMIHKFSWYVESDLLVPNLVYGYDHGYDTAFIRAANMIIRRSFGHRSYGLRRSRLEQLCSADALASQELAGRGAATRVSPKAVVAEPGVARQIQPRMLAVAG
jgi:hypothetical protein